MSKDIPKFKRKQEENEYGYKEQKKQQLRKKKKEKHNQKHIQEQTT